MESRIDQERIKTGEDKKYRSPAYAISIEGSRPLKNVQFCPRSRRVRILTTGIY